MPRHWVVRNKQHDALVVIVYSAIGMAVMIAILVLLDVLAFTSSASGK